MDHHLAGDGGAGNTRSGYGCKTVTTEAGKLEIEVPRDRQLSFDPQLIAKYQRRFAGFDDKIISMYARGMSTQEITLNLRNLYGVGVSPDLISTVTDAVLDEVTTWQQRPLDAIYPLVVFDALRMKIRDEGMFRNWRTILPWAFAPMAQRRCSACGSSKMKAPSSGCGS